MKIILLGEEEKVAETDDKGGGEPQYLDAIALITARGYERLGLMTSWAWYDDPKRLAFMFARYKFVSKMLAGAKHVLELGCGDGIGARIVRQSVGAVTAVDFDGDFIRSARDVASDRWPVTFIVHDLLSGPVSGRFDGIYSLDVLEHIQPAQEDLFIENLLASLDPHGVVILGMPSLASQAYASAHSKIGHVNCKDQPEFKVLMLKYFHNVFMFSMNDEVVHTGSHAMSHYNLALCVARKR